MEQLLPGGSTNKVHLVDGTVRRLTSPWSPTVHELLLHLESVDYPYSPRFLGLDDKGREILSFIDGAPASRPWPAPVLEPDGLRPFVRIVRAYHDAVAGFIPSQPNWWIGKRPVLPGELVCHGDLGLWNFVHRDGVPLALVDWDKIRPGTALRDVAEFAWNAVPLRGPGLASRAGLPPDVDRRARLAVIVEEYGGPSPIEVIHEVIRQQDEEREMVARLGPRGIEPWATLLGYGEDPEHVADFQWMLDHIDDLI